MKIKRTYWFIILTHIIGSLPFGALFALGLSIFLNPMSNPDPSARSGSIVMMAMFGAFFLIIQVLCIGLYIFLSPLPCEIEGDKVKFTPFRKTLTFKTSDIEWWSCSSRNRTSSLMFELADGRKAGADFLKPLNEEERKKLTSLLGFAPNTRRRAEVETEGVSEFYLRRNLGRWPWLCSLFCFFLSLPGIYMTCAYFLATEQDGITPHFLPFLVCGLVLAFLSFLSLIALIFLLSQKKIKATFKDGQVSFKKGFKDLSIPYSSIASIKVLSPAFQKEHYARIPLLILTASDHKSYRILFPDLNSRSLAAMEKLTGLTIDASHLL
jgi:hypothetical protein